MRCGAGEQAGQIYKRSWASNFHLSKELALTVHGFLSPPIRTSRYRCAAQPIGLCYLKAARKYLPEVTVLIKDCTGVIREDGDHSSGTSLSEVLPGCRCVAFLNFSSVLPLRQAFRGDEAGLWPSTRRCQHLVVVSPYPGGLEVAAGERLTCRLMGGSMPRRARSLLASPMLIL
jgi:hypothetical protein